ncbi:MAG TPA: FkbM family methyltransferase, partial [Ferruginibacter sp.]|nr:FkbM family methyltransferase [Ferruginibacter sp.]
KKGSDLFKDLSRVDFIKCDIEGYEEFVFPEMEPILVKHKPVIQVETWGTHKNVVETFLKRIGYKQYELENGSLVLSGDQNPEQVDFIFFHPVNEKAMEKLKEIQKNNTAINPNRVQAHLPTY